jgi:hypothetical protein
MPLDLASFPETHDTHEDDLVGPVEFDFLSGPNSLDVTTISETVSPYFGFKFQ